MPSAVPLWNSMRSIQRINIVNTLASSRRTLRVLYPPGNDTVLDVSVTAGAGGNASMLLHPLLGLNVSVNGVGLPSLVPVSGGQAAVDQLRSMLQTALKLTALDVGVELLPTQGAGVTFRVAVPLSKVRPSACPVTTIGGFISVNVASACMRPAPWIVCILVCICLSDLLVLR